MRSDNIGELVPFGGDVMLYYSQGFTVEGGILSEDTSDSRMDAVVVAVGPRVGPDIAVGMTVIADRFSGIPVSHNGIVYRKVKSTDILAVISNTEGNEHESKGSKKRGTHR